MRSVSSFFVLVLYFALFLLISSSLSKNHHYLILSASAICVLFAMAVQFNALRKTNMNSLGSRIHFCNGLLTASIRSLKTVSSNGAEEKLGCELQELELNWEKQRMMHWAKKSSGSSDDKAAKLTGKGPKSASTRIWAKDPVRITNADKRPGAVTAKISSMATKKPASATRKVIRWSAKDLSPVEKVMKSHGKSTPKRPLKMNTFENLNVKLVKGPTRNNKEVSAVNKRNLHYHHDAANGGKIHVEGNKNVSDAVNLQKDVEPQQSLELDKKDLHTDTENPQNVMSSLLCQNRIHCASNDIKKVIVNEGPEGFFESDEPEFLTNAKRSVKVSVLIQKEKAQKSYILSENLYCYEQKYEHFKSYI